MSGQQKGAPPACSGDGGSSQGMLSQLFGCRLRPAQSAVFSHWTAGIRACGLSVSRGQGGDQILIDRNRRITRRGLARLTTWNRLPLLQQRGLVVARPRDTMPSAGCTAAE